jgi:exonuclease SbcD
MRASFLHLADVHLGYEQYGSRERFLDFGKAFKRILKDAIERHVDFVVIAGDLFNKRAIDAQTLMQAQDALKMLQEAGIPAVAIEGNHDRAYYREGTSWLQFLAWEGLLRLLDPMWSGGTLVLTPWHEKALHAGYIDFHGGRLRVYGLPWYGASTARMIEGLAAALRAVRTAEDEAGVEYRLLVLHTGLEGEVPQMHGLPTWAQFQPLRSLVDYVALGHVHKPYEKENWLFNPGSTETWSAEETAWDRGYYYVTVDTEAARKDPSLPKHWPQHIKNRQRPFYRYQFRVDGLQEPAGLYERLEHFCATEASTRNDQDIKPVVEISLYGTLLFDLSALDRTRVEEIIARHFNALLVRVHLNTQDRENDIAEDEDELDRANWHRLEQRIFGELLARDVRFAAHQGEWARLLAELKRMALEGEPAPAVAERLRTGWEELRPAPPA